MREYDSGSADLFFAEVADLIRALGFSASHVVLIGGIVPGLLVPVLEPGISPHVGTADIDLCLSLALIDGDTVTTYERIEVVLRRLGFEETDTTFRWRRPTGLKITVEFFCPAGPDRPAGRVYRPKQADNPIGKHNLGGKLGALALEAGEVLTTDTETITRSVDLPDGKGNVAVAVHVTGPLGFLSAKAQALLERDKPKDAYDIVWLLESWPGGPAAAASAFAARPAFGEPVVASTLESLRDAFASTTSIGTRSYARFVSEDAAEQAGLERRAMGAMAEFLRALPVNPATDAG